VDAHSPEAVKVAFFRSLFCGREEVYAEVDGQKPASLVLEQRVYANDAAAEKMALDERPRIITWI